MSPGSDETHRLHASLSQFKQLLALTPQDPLLLDRVAGIYVRLGRPVEAADYLADRAEIHFEAGHLHEAARDCERALFQVPEHPRARLLLEGLRSRGVGAASEDDTAIAAAAEEGTAPEHTLAQDEDGIITLRQPAAAYELRVMPATIPPEGLESLRRTPVVDAESLLATHDADEFSLGVDPPTLPPDFLEPADDPEDVAPHSFLAPSPTPGTRSATLERAITSKLPRIAPPSAGPQAVPASESGPVSAAVDMFQALPRGVLRGLMARAERRTFGEEQKLAAQGAPADGMLVITRGRARVERLSERGRERLGFAGDDDVIGLVEHLRGARWRATVLAETEVECRLLPNAEMARLRMAYPALDRSLRGEAEHQELLLLLTTGPLFHSLNSGAREALARLFRARTLLADEAVAREGEPVEGLYLVRGGKLSQSKGGQRLSSLTVGDCAGVLAALEGGMSPVTVVAEEGGEAFFLEWAEVEAVLEDPGVRAAFERLAPLRRLVT